MTIYVAPEAEEDLAAVIGYLADRNEAAARNLGQKIFEVIDRLASHEFDGPELELDSGDVVRSWPVPPLRIYHQARAPLAR